MLTAFMTLGHVDTCESQRFVALCESLASARDWRQVLSALRAWVREVTGGAACSMRQWAARFSSFHVVVFDCETFRPRVVTDGADSVAFVLASALLHEDITQPPRENRWMDVEEVVPASALCLCVRPAPFFHFTTEAPSPPLSILNAQTIMLQAPSVHFTWQAAWPEPQRGLLSLFTSHGWQSFMIPRVSCRRETNVQQVLCMFALGFLPWLVVPFVLAIAGRPEHPHSPAVSAVVAM